MKKSYAILVIYDLLENSEPFQVKDMESKLGCSRRTCLRYTKDIKDYLREYQPGKSLVYDRKNQTITIRKVPVNESTPDN